jgi:quinol monooxygenase YgiN
MSTVIVQGVFRVNPAERDAYLAASSDTMRSSRAEQGCLEYVLAADPLDEGRVILSERWQSRPDLDAHIQGLAARRSEAAAQGGGADPGPVPISREVTIYEVATEQVLG